MVLSEWRGSIHTRELVEEALRNDWKIRPTGKGAVEQDFNSQDGSCNWHSTSKWYEVIGTAKIEHRIEV